MRSPQVSLVAFHFQSGMITRRDIVIVRPALPAGPGPTDSDKLVTTCASNWRAVQAQEDKKISKIFDETGIFLACCRHGLIDVVTDMVQSGELYVTDSVNNEPH